jgi:hypothetical protein
MNTSSGLCNSCGVYIGTENWSSCPNCGHKVDSGDGENDDDDENDEDDDDDQDADEDEQF